MAEKTSPQQRPGADKGNGMTKKEALRLALEELGKDAKPAELQPYIKATFGIDMTPGHITTAKGELRRGKGGKGKPAAKKQPSAPQPKEQLAPKPQAEQPARAAAGGSGVRNGISLEDIQAVKGLVGRIGAERLQTLIDLLSR